MAKVTALCLDTITAKSNPNLPAQQAKKVGLEALEQAGKSAVPKLDGFAWKKPTAAQPGYLLKGKLEVEAKDPSPKIALSIALKLEVVPRHGAKPSSPSTVTAKKSVQLDAKADLAQALQKLVRELALSMLTKQLGKGLSKAAEGA